MRVRTYSKLNLYLRVFPLRDDGFHDIVSVMQTVDLSDEMELTPQGDGLVLECNKPDVPLDERNTVHQVYSRLKEKYPDDIGGLKVSIEKNIPMESGLAGGSGNAAGAIIGMDRLFSLGMTYQDMKSCAISVGSDVPFLLTGGCALVSGRGERVEKMAAGIGKYYIVVKPVGDGVSSTGAYQLLDKQRLEFPMADTDAEKAYTEARSAWLTAIAEGNVSNLMHNDFSESIMACRPEIAEVKEKMLGYGLPAVLTGSGSALFSLMDDYNKVLDALVQMNETYGESVFVVSPVPQGVEIID